MHVKFWTSDGCIWWQISDQTTAHETRQLHPETNRIQQFKSLYNINIRRVWRMNGKLTSLISELEWIKCLTWDKQYLDCIWDNEGERSVMMNWMQRLQSSKTADLQQTITHITNGNESDFSAVMHGAMAKQFHVPRDTNISAMLSDRLHVKQCERFVTAKWLHWIWITYCWHLRQRIGQTAHWNGSDCSDVMHVLHGVTQLQTTPKTNKSAMHEW